MGYEQWWIVLEELVEELRKQQVAVPSSLMTRLKSAKTLIKVYYADTSHVETIQSLEDYLLQVESSLMNIVKEKFGKAFMELCIKKLESARREEPKKPSPQRFIPGLPKDGHWIRVLPSDDILRVDIVQLAEGLGLSTKSQDDGFTLVYGKQDQISEFIKSMAEKYRRERKKKPEA